MAATMLERKNEDRMVLPDGLFGKNTEGVAAACIVVQAESTCKLAGILCALEEQSEQIIG